MSSKVCPHTITIRWSYCHRFCHWCRMCDAKWGMSEKTIKRHYPQKSILRYDIARSFRLRQTHGTTKPKFWSNCSLFRMNSGTGEFLNSTGQERVIKCVDELLMQAWEPNNGRKTEGGIYRKGQRQKTMKIKFEKNFCRQIKELATTNRWNYFDSSHVGVHSRKSGRNNLILISSENMSGLFWDVTQRIMVIPYRPFGATYREIDEICALPWYYAAEACNNL